MNEKIQVITSVCDALQEQNIPLASRIFLTSAPIDKDYKIPKSLKLKKISNEDKKLNPKPKTKREYTELEATRLFIRDGFIDRYTGKKLIFIGTLRLLSEILPNEFPYQSNWKIGVCHHWYWELSPTLDHVDPVTNGGADQETNWVTTSMANNLIKSNTPLGQLGWSVLPSGNFAEWDGYIYWFINYMETKPEILKQKTALKKWYKIAKEAFEYQT